MSKLDASGCVAICVTLEKSAKGAVVKIVSTVADWWVKNRVISNKNRRLIAIAMLKDIKTTIKKEKLIDWFIDVSEKGSDITMYDVSVNDIVGLAESIGIEVKI
jgi:hypothetical protein